MSPKFRVAICGGGIGGLTLAVALGQFSDVPIDVYESAPEIGTVGVGLAVWKRTWEVMRQLGLEPEMEKRNIPRPTEGDHLGMVWRRSDQSTEGVELHRMIAPYGPIPLHRSVLVDMLKSRLPTTCTIHTSKTATFYVRNTSGSFTLHFSDETTAETDVLVGADGIRSAVRKSLFGNAAQAGTLLKNFSSPESLQKVVEPQWSGTMAYRSLISVDKLQKAYPNHPVMSAQAGVCYSGKGKHIIAYKISDAMINFIAFYTIPGGEGTPFEGRWVSDAPKEEVMEHFEGWEPSVRTMLVCLEPVTSRWAIHVGASLPLCVSANVALIGDAMHAMTTHVSAGAGQAMEDAYLLARLLAHNLATKETIPAVLKIYEDIRLPIANDVVAKSREVGLMYDFNGSEYSGVGRNDEDALKRWREAIYKRWEFQWTGSPEDDWVEAQKRLKADVEVKL